MRLLCLTVSTILLAPFAGANFYPSFPEGWEENTDPRFQPPIEEVAQTLSFHPGKQDLQDAQFAWHKWGPEAIPVLQGLYNSPQWAGFRHGFTVLICICHHEEGATARETLFTRTLRQESDYVRATPATHSFLGVFTEYNEPEATALLRSLAAQENPSLRVLAASWLQRLDDKYRPIVNQIIDAYDDSDDLEIRKHVVELLMGRVTREDYARALKIAKTISIEYHATVEARIEMFQDQIRAKEPMRFVLEREKHLGDR